MTIPSESEIIYDDPAFARVETTSNADNNIVISGDKTNNDDLENDGPENYATATLCGNNSIQNATALVEAYLVEDIVDENGDPALAEAPTAPAPAVTGITTIDLKKKDIRSLCFIVILIGIISSITGIVVWRLSQPKLHFNTPISVGSSHTCVTNSKNKLYCWGWNSNGQVGGYKRKKAVPTRISLPDEMKVTKIALGFEHSCVVLNDIRLYCWGYNSYGQLGDNSKISRYVPKKINIKKGSNISQIALGFDHTCILFDDGNISCWGRNAYGQLGDGTTSNRKVPTASIAVKKKVVQVATGKDYTCAITIDKTLQCWGQNHHGQLGDGTNHSTKNPTEGNIIDNSKSVKLVATGICHTCAISQDDSLYCWGCNQLGQVGDGTKGDKSLPKKIIVNGNMKIKHLAVGAYHTCVILDDDSLWCWGYNNDGQLGDGTTTNAHVPTKINVGDGRHVTQMALGYEHTCAKFDDNTMRCWGSNIFGQLGIGSRYPFYIPYASKSKYISL